MNAAPYCWKEVAVHPVTVGVYALICDGNVIYVGQSRHVYARVAEHQRNKHFDSVMVCQLAEEDLDDVETFLIAMLNPPLNRVHADGKAKGKCRKRNAYRLLPFATKFRPSQFLDYSAKWQAKHLRLFLKVRHYGRPNYMENVGMKLATHGVGLKLARLHKGKTART
jgi:hypothetical protein